MKIKWLGHSCFVLEESTGTVIVTDPYAEAATGIEFPDGISANAVTVSHRHSDHDNIAAVQTEKVLDTIGSFEVDGVHIYSLNSSHDSHCGKKRGGNLIFKFRIDGVDICHMGDVGEPCSPRLGESIGSVNVLLIPVGGNYTIDAEQAKEYVDFLMPDIVIPMHFKTKDCNLDIDKVDDFVELFEDEDIIEVEGNEIEFDRTHFDNESTKVLVFSN